VDTFVNNNYYLCIVFQKCHPMKKIIARDKEISRLEELYNSKRPEFVIVYGRRRIGKTYLVNQVFEKRFTFSFVGAKKESQKVQLKRFAAQLQRYGSSTFTPALDTWEDAFDELRRLIESKPKKQRKVIFLDEMPWIDTPRSRFLSALEYFWNAWAAQRDDIMFIACGSATSWMVNRILRNRGGLHNRFTAQIYLRPFNLNESEEFLHSSGCNWDRYTILQSYMTFGGVPYYLSQLNSKESLAQNIDRLFFAKNAPMKLEFDELFSALFPHADKYVDVMKALSQKRGGMMRSEIIASTGISGGGLSKILDNLERCDFITIYSRYKSSVRNSLYRICDPYTLFYFKFVHSRNRKDVHFWSNNLTSPSVVAWQGFSFETICIEHLDQIKRKLGISGIGTNSCTWRKVGTKDEQGTQIDLLIERADRVINICEMKFSDSAYSITKDYENKLRTKLSVFREETRTTKSVLLTMVTTYGITMGIHSGIVTNEVCMNDLFEKAY
jgi:AAA+ ATPase superfamily predicted ATPase